jgi:hypothetical protein
MSKTTNYEVSDTFLGRVSQYTSAVWDSWGKNVDKYIKRLINVCYNHT